MQEDKGKGFAERRGERKGESKVRSPCGEKTASGALAERESREVSGTRVEHSRKLVEWYPSRDRSFDYGLEKCSVLREGKCKSDGENNVYRIACTKSFDRTSPRHVGDEC